MVTRERVNKHVVKARSLMRRALHVYTISFIEAIKKANTLQEMQTVAHRQLRGDVINEAMRRIWIASAKDFGEDTRKRIVSGKKKLVVPITADYWQSWVETQMKGSFGKRITWVTGTTRDRFINAVDTIAATGFEKGESINTIAGSIMESLRIEEAYRAERIARTEVMSAANMSSQAGAQATGLELNKEWICQIDGRQRDSHEDMNGETVDINEPFSNGLDVPCDSSVDNPAEVINCRCTVAYAAKEGVEYSWGRE